MQNELVKTYIDEIKFLLKLKGVIGILNNRIHDKLGLIAIEKFKSRFPALEFKPVNASVAGIDIEGFDKKSKKKILVGEIKTTLLFTSSLRGPQKRAIEKDLERLMAEKDAKYKFLIVLSLKTQQAIERQLRTKEKCPDIEIVNALDDKDLEELGLTQDSQENGLKE